MVEKVKSLYLPPPRALMRAGERGRLRRRFWLGALTPRGMVEEQAPAFLTDAVKQGAILDRKASLESWGPEAFARRTRRKLHNIRLPTPPQHYSPEDSTKSVNILLLGPTGAGKSSLTYTFWRALAGGLGTRDAFFTNNAHTSLLKRLRVGWRPEGKGNALVADARHGTTSFCACELQVHDPETGAAGVTVHDTIGQQFFTHEEERMAEELLEGQLKPGSSMDHKNFRFWFMLGHFGLFSSASLGTSPHVVVLVFDVCLRSFHSMLEQGSVSELAQCYRKVLRKAEKQGCQAYAALTHVDVYKPDEEHDSDSEEGERKPFNHEEDMPGIVKEWKRKLSQALGQGNARGGGGSLLLPEECIVPVQNYSASKMEGDAELDMYALSFLDKLVESSLSHIAQRYSSGASSCLVS
ncbi:unnamed protein product [Chrysoparadoxa australica]